MVFPSNDSMKEYAQHLTALLDQVPLYMQQTNPYIDLTETPDLDTFIGSDQTLELAEDPLIYAFEAILTRISLGQIDRVKLGINELLKSLIKHITPANEEYLTKQYLYRVRLLFKRSIVGDFPYYDDLWDYISNSFNTVGIYLIEANYLTATKLLLETTAKLGKIAAQKGLATSSTQWCLRNLENKAFSLNLVDLGNSAKNLRFNLESY